MAELRARARAAWLAFRKRRELECEQCGRVMVRSIDTRGPELIYCGRACRVLAYDGRADRHLRIVRDRDLTQG